MFSVAVATSEFAVAASIAFGLRYFDSPSGVVLILILPSDSSKNMGKMVKLHKLPGFKKKQRGVQKDSKERTQRRAAHQVANAMLQIVLHLAGLDAMSKVPLEQASDCVCLALFLVGLLQSGCSRPVACILFLCARHLRTPKLVKVLMKRACKQKPKSPAETVLWLEAELKKKPFILQKNGYPYWTAFTSFHNGRHVFCKWIAPDQQVLLFSAVSGLCDYVDSTAQISIFECMDRIKRLPHAKSYGFDIVRLWSTSLKLCQQQLPQSMRTRFYDEAEELVAQNMAPHIRILWLLFDRIDKKENSWGKLAKKFGLSRAAFSAGSRSLLCCESQAFFGHLGYVPAQHTLNEYMSVEEYASKCNLQMLRNLQKYLEEPGRTLEKGKIVSTCPLEKEEVLKHFPEANRLKHSSFSAKNFVQALPKALRL